ncbi:MAG: tRNA epoxyqueuosine(34) reductase QueG [Myxococcales bacterium]|nr:tRNA epoxyqueuosine(34) reductase QueG [Myxococcales bacterium]
MSDDALTARIVAEATRLGFHRVGIAAAGPLSVDHPRYEAFVAEGLHGEMGFLAEDAAVRRDVDHPGILQGAKSVIVCALSYHRRDAPSPLTGATVARYAQGRDYHNFFRKRLRKLAKFVRTLGGEARPTVDTAPLLERAWAARAGVGFVGKNGMIIAPGLGSYLLLGEVVTDLVLTPGAPLSSRCGACTLCLDGCPTRAFAAPYRLDPRRCIAYLTIEQKGAIAPALRPLVGDRLFGCDTCQDLCPFNRTAPPPAEGTRDFEPDPRYAGRAVEDLLTLDDAGFAALTEGTPLARATRPGLARNAAVVIGNTGGRRHLPVLRQTVNTDPNALVRETAAWAIDQIEARDPSR